MEFVLDWWPVFLGVTGFVFWMARLESRVNSNSKELKRIEERFVKQREEDLANRDKAFEKIDLALNTIQSDIKKLIQHEADRKDR